MNIIPHNDDLIGLEEYVRVLVDIGVDALIVADAGLYTAVRSVSKDIEEEDIIDDETPINREHPFIAYVITKIIFFKFQINS